MPSLKTLMEACSPRSEVLTGELRDEMFAARLNDVVRGKAHPVYQNPEAFFANTYPTARMQSFFNEVMGRLSGTDRTASAFFRLDTPFGGGKTHTLIALYHLATASLVEATLERLHLSRSALPSEKVKVVAVVGDDMNPADGVEREGVRVHHLWGEIAVQLGGRAGYSLVERSDTQGLAPDTSFLDALAGDRPVLFLIDELARYMRATGPAASQVPAFLKSFADWITGGTRRAVLVLTLVVDPATGRAAKGDAFARETEAITEAIQEVQSVLARPVRVVTPAEKNDIAPLLRQRLFETVDMAAASPIADAYLQALRQAQQRGVPVPVGAVQAKYSGDLRDSYPFHPALIEVLDGKLATIPNFQKTRGALRLLARVVRRLWDQKRTSGLLIHPFSIDLCDADIVDELTGRLDRPGFRSVVAYDVAHPDGQSHAQALDRERFAGHPPYSQRIATTLFLHSLPEPPARGADLDELVAATLTPDSDPAHLQKALEYLADEAWHLDFEGKRYFFRTEPSLNKLVLDEMQSVPLHEARAEVERRIRQLWRDAGLGVSCFPNEPSDLPNDARGRLVLLHWDTAAFKPGDKKAPARVQELWEYAGVQREYRTFRNTLFFLVADADRHQRMVELARRWLALDGLLRNSQKLDDYKLSKEHRQRLEEWRKEANLHARLAITGAYCHLFYPVGETDLPYKPFAHQSLQVEDRGDTKANHTEIVLKALRDLGKVKSASDAPMAPALVKRDAFGKDESSVPLQELFERFAQRVRLPLLLEPTYLKEIVRSGVQTKVWLYYDRAANLAYDTHQYLPDIVVDNEHELILPEAVKARGIPVYQREEPKPPDTEQEKEIKEGRAGAPVVEPVREVETEAEPRKALSDIAARARDAGWPALGVLQLRWQAEGRDVQSRLSALLTILGHVPDASAEVDVSVACQFQDGASWSSEFKGPSARYKAIASAVDGMVREASEAHAAVGLTLQFPRGLPLRGGEFEDLRDTLDLAGLGRTQMVAWPFKESGQ